MGFVLPDEAVARIHEHFRTAATGCWRGRRLTELLTGTPVRGRGRRHADGGSLRLAGRTGVLLALHRSRTTRAAAAVASLERVGKLAQRVADSLHAVVRRERCKLGHALHDTLAQTFTELVFVTDALACDVRERRRSEPIGKARIGGARPPGNPGHPEQRPGAGDYPFPASIADIVVDLRQSGVDVQLHEPADTGALPPQVERCLRYAAREALVNIRRHAAADRVDIALESQGDRVVLTVTDNGSRSRARGRETVRPWGGLGLCLLRELIEAEAGSLDLTSAPDGGSC